MNFNAQDKVLSSKNKVQTQIKSSINDEGKITVTPEQLNELHQFIEDYVVPYVTSKNEPYWIKNDSYQYAIGSDEMLKQAKANQPQWLPSILGITNWGGMDSDNNLQFSIFIENFNNSNSFDQLSFTNGWAIKEYNGSFRITTPSFKCPHIILNSDGKLSPTQKQLNELKTFVQNYVANYVTLKNFPFWSNRDEMLKRANENRPKWLPEISAIGNWGELDSNNNLQFSIKIKNFNYSNSFDTSAFTNGWSIDQYDGSFLIVTPSFNCPNAK